MGSPATVTPGWLLVSPSGLEKGRLWSQVRIRTPEHTATHQREGVTGTEPLHDDTVACSRRGVVVVVVVVAVVVLVVVVVVVVDGVVVAVADLDDG